MSTPDSSPFSVAQQKAVINADLNSILIFQFLFGIYTGVFPATLYIYFHKENRTRVKDIIVIGSITALYSVTTLDLLVNWVDTNLPFNTLSGELSTRLNFVETFSAYSGYILADSLLTWRCFHACSCSIRKAFLPVFLFAVETALVITVMVFNFLKNANPDFATIQRIHIFDHLVPYTFVAVAATSTISTGMICLQIWRHTRHSSRSRKRYQTIINALIECSAIYTVVVLFQAILDFIPAGDGNIEASFAVFLLDFFVSEIVQVISGLAPTVMVARLFLSSGQDDMEVSSARLPSELISCASHAAGDNLVTTAADIEMQQNGSMGVGQQESGEIRMVTRSQC
ncbi:hypothetical protein CPC08DRAFT_754364 [Agrocybe pediades]|nr:hypothetical protein CPC08DRAFT_754364 [Agrocybe pediades]